MGIIHVWSADTSAKSEKYVKNPNLIGCFYLTNLLEPRFRTSIIDFNSNFRDAGIVIDMCLGKGVVIEDIIFFN
jgi:hypothetical protein